MTMTSGTPRSRRRGLYGLLAGGLLSASAAALIALPMASTANAQCDQTVGSWPKSWRGERLTMAFH